MPFWWIHLIAASDKDSNPSLFYVQDLQKVYAVSGETCKRRVFVIITLVLYLLKIFPGLLNRTLTLSKMFCWQMKGWVVYIGLFTLCFWFFSDNNLLIFCFILYPFFFCLNHYIYVTHTHIHIHKLKTLKGTYLHFRVSKYL